MMGGLAFAATTNLSMAATLSGGSSVPTVQISQVSDITKILCTVFGWMFWILIAFSMIVIIYAAFIYATAGDDASKVSTATKTITYAAAGIAVAFLARAVPLIVANFFGVTGFNAC